MDGQEANGEESRITASLLVPIVQTTYDPNKELEELVGVSLRRPLPLWGGGPRCQLAYQLGADVSLSNWNWRPLGSTSWRGWTPGSERATCQVYTEPHDRD